MELIVGPIGCRPNRGFHHHLHLHLHLHHHPAVSRLSINSHIQAISALPPTYHTSPERGHYQGSSGDDKDNDKDTHKDKYEDKDKDRTFFNVILKYVKAEMGSVTVSGGVRLSGGKSFVNTKIVTLDFGAG